MSFMIFFLVYFVAFFLQTYTIKKRFINKLNFSLKTRKYLGFALYLTFFGALLYPMARYFPLVPNWLYFLLSLPIGVIFLTFMITIFHDITWIFFKIKNIITKKKFFQKNFWYWCNFTNSCNKSKSDWQCKRYWTWSCRCRD